MKFKLQQVKHGCRLGIVEGFEEIAAKGLETPMCMLYTRAGSVPCLTRDMLDRIENPPKIVHMPLPSLVEHHETLKAFGKGIKKFTAMTGYKVYCSLQDPALKTPSGYNDKKGISVWPKGGRVQINHDLFKKLVDAFDADFYQILCDTDTDNESTTKRLAKSHQRSVDYLHECMEEQKTSKSFQNPWLFGTVTGGYNKAERLRSVNTLIEYDIPGVIFEGFHQFGPETEKFQFTEVKDLMTETRNVLDKKPNMLRIWHGILNPVNVCHAVEMGIDIMDSSYPYIVTERDSALVFGCDMATDNSSKGEPCGVAGEINLKDKSYFEDLSPILPHCTCYTCKNHTKSYISHLLNTSELLAGVLLNIHNFHHYFRFFEALRRSLQEDTYPQFRTFITQQCQSGS